MLLRIPGSADLALLNDPAGHQGFTDLLIRAAVARHARRQRGWEALPAPGNGYAVFASRDISAGRDHHGLRGHPAHPRDPRAWVEEQWGRREQDWFRAYAWPLTDEVWVTWPEDPEEWRPINHSCDPNAWLEGLDLVARRGIAQGEEIRVDYATYGNNILAPFDCTCGATECRGRIREDDHLQPFMERYGDHISDYVAKRANGEDAETSSFSRPRQNHHTLRETCFRDHCRHGHGRDRPLRKTGVGGARPPGPKRFPQRSFPGSQKP